MDTDRIEREIVIDAPVDRVWFFVTEPGFWVGEGDPERVELREGATVVSEHAEYGRFPMRVERIEPPRFISYRWASTFPGAEPGDGTSTLVEFSLTADGDKTLLRVVESGFASLAASEETRRKSYEDNVGGWIEELDALKERVEKSAV